MFLQSLTRRPLAIAGTLAIGAAVAVSSLNVVRADPHKVQPAKTCNKSSACFYVQNSGIALEGVTTNANTRALYIYATSAGADATDLNGGYIGTITRAPVPPSGVLYPIVMTDSNGNNLDWTDTNGNIAYHGSLNHFLRTRHGQKVVSYATESTTKTLEDVGTARLVNGQATIVLERTFADAIETQSAYHVFLTPNGDTKGLYVAQKSPMSFVVRETQGGHGSFSFDYRVIGTSLGHSGERMGTVRVPEEPNAPIRK